MDTDINVTNIEESLCGLLVKEDDKILTNLGTMAAMIAYYNFQWRYIALIMFFSTRYSQAVDTFLSHYNQSVVVKLGKFRRRHSATVPQFVIFGEESSEIIETLRWLLHEKFENTGNFIIICYSADHEQCDENEFFKTVVDIYIVNVIFLKISDINEEPVSFSYNMVLPGKCRNSDPQRLNLRNDCIDDKCFHFLFDEKFKDLYKCPLVVSTFEQPPYMYLQNGEMEPTGGDGDMLKVVTSALNATLVIKTPSDGSDFGHYENNNWTGSLGDIFNDRANISVCSLPLTSNKYGNFQISFIYNTMDIMWIAQLPPLKPSWEKMMYPFNMRARLAILLTFVGVITLNTFVQSKLWRQIIKPLNIPSPKRNLFFYSWLIFLGIPILREPSKRSFLVIFYTWIWFCFIMRSCYQAALISSLKQQVYQDYFESFDDVLQSRRAFGGQGTFREYYVEDQYIYENWVELDSQDSYEMLHKISNGTSDFVMAINKEIAIELLLQYNGTRRLQMMPRKILNSPTVMYLRKYSPLTAPLSTILSRAVEAGYAQFWHMRFARQRKHLFGHSQSPEPEPLTLEHFSGCIVIIIIGWILSILFFLIELCCGQLEDDKLNIGI